MSHETCVIKHGARPLGSLKVRDIPHCVNPGHGSPIEGECEWRLCDVCAGVRRVSILALDGGS